MMAVYEIESEHGRFVVIYTWGYDPFAWRILPPCLDCGIDCCRVDPDSERCTGAYEGICHKIYEASFGPIPE